MKTIKILIVDDHPIYSYGLSQILNSIYSQPTIMHASSVKSAQSIIDENLDIDWIFLDLNLPDSNGIALVNYCHSQNYLCPIIIVSASDDPNLFQQCIEAGANGLMSKNSNSFAIEACLQQIEQQSIYIQPQIESLIEHVSESPFPSLSGRQREVLLLIGEGYSNKEISKILDIAIGTVKRHVSNIMTLFQTDNRTHCAAEARRQGVIV